MKNFSIKCFGFQVLPIINSMMIKEARDKARKKDKEPISAGFAARQYPESFISAEEQATETNY